MKVMLPIFMFFDVMQGGVSCRTHCTATMCSSTRITGSPFRVVPTAQPHCVAPPGSPVLHFVCYPLHSHTVQLHQDHRFSISPYPLHSHNVQLHQDHRFSIQSRAFSILRVQNGGYCGRTYCAESMTDFFLQKGQIRHKFINL